MSATIDEHTVLVKAISQQSQLLVDTLVPRADLEYLKYTASVIQCLISILRRGSSSVVNVGDKGARSTDSEPGKRKRKKLGTSESAVGVSSHSLVSLCRHSSDVAMYVVSFFISLRSCPSMACTSSELLYTAGLLPPPHPINYRSLHPHDTSSKMGHGKRKLCSRGRSLIVS